jgi:predicted ATPase
MVEYFRDGAWFVPLADIGSAEQMVYTIASVLRLPLTAQDSAQQQLIDGLHERELLLLVDNLEHIQGAAAILQTIAAQVPTVSLLLTSREPTGVVGETVIELEGLSTRPLAGKPDIEDSSAVRLFMHIAEQRCHKLDPADLQPVSEICHLVEGMPLGIELAGAWIELFTCREIADQLARNYDILSKTPQGRQHGSLRAVFEYFWRQLSSDEQRVVRRLGVFRGGLEREAASAIAGASPFLLAALVHKVFLTRTNAGRYSLHKLLQQDAERQLAAWPEDRDAVLLEHARYYCSTAERAAAEIHGIDQTNWLDRLAAEHDNVRTALAWALDSDHIEYGLELIKHLGHYWRVRGHCSEGRTWIDQFLTQCPPSMPERVGALRWAGILAQEQGDYVQARAFLIDYLAIARAHEDDSSIADALGYLGWIASVQGEYAQAHLFLQEGLDLVRPLNEPITTLHILNNLGEVTHRQATLFNQRRITPKHLHAHEHWATGVKSVKACWG